MLRVECEHCGASYRVAPVNMGRRARCSRCGQSFELREGASYWRAALDEAERLYGGKPVGCEAEHRGIEPSGKA